MKKEAPRNEGLLFYCIQTAKDSGASRVPSLKSAPKGRHHHPQRQSRCRPLSEAIHNPPPAGGHNPRAKGPSTLTPQVCPMARAATVISSGAARRYGADGNRSDDTLSREISRPNASWTIEE